jgi:hypothetical protein
METSHETTLIIQIWIFIDLGNILKVIYLTEFVNIFKRAVLVIFNWFLVHHLNIRNVSDASWRVGIIHLTKLWVFFFEIESSVSSTNSLFTLFVNCVGNSCLTIEIAVITHHLFFILELKILFILFHQITFILTFTIQILEIVFNWFFWSSRYLRNI